MKRQTPQLIALAAFIGSAVGVFLPWATVGSVYTESGTDNDGIVALPLALAGAFVIATSSAATRSWLAALVAVALIGVGVMGVMEVRDGIEEFDEFGILGDLLSAFELEPKVGYGLMLVIAGAAAATVMSVIHALSFKREGPGDSP
ncbi:MAG TPA: hypothetical protein VJB57_02900 [Dehalococcoidia bacterium]|nr:hypothetical protein [Dehalococcoidia bacterium]